MFRSLRLALPAACLAVLAACATPPAQMMDRVADDDFSKPAATAVFAAGFENIADKYLDPLATDTIGLEALRGLGSLDPAVAVQREGDEITLTADGEEIARLAVPAEATPRQWARLMTQATTAVRAWSDDTRQVDAERVYEAVFDGMLSELDIYSRYAGAEDARRNRARRDGFGGIGIRFRLAEGAVEIIRVVPDTPASEGGLKPGDRVVAADGVTLEGLSVREISKILRGPVDTVITLTVAESGADDAAFRHVALTRRHIVPVTVTAKTEDGVLILKVASFNQKTADSVRNIVERTRRDLGRDFKGLVLDLSGNPGGLLRQSIKLANLFLTQGHIISTRGRHPDSIHHYAADGDDLLEGRPLVVLVDGKSASASEIAAAALQDRNRAVVVGTSSYGKGSVQTVIRLPNDGELTITWSRLVAPSGYTLHGLGVHPAVCTSSRAPGAPDRVMAAIETANEAAEIFAQWRRPGLLDKEERVRLRKTCPPERHDGGADGQIAKRIVLDQALYARALALTAATAQAGGKQIGW